MIFIKKPLLYIILYYFLIFLIPFSVCFFAVETNNLSYSTKVEINKKMENGKIKSYISALDTLQEFSLEEYLMGVVAAEMPASFPLDALKAQAVAARTFVISKVANDKGDVSEHKGAPVCTNPAHCKAWKSLDELKNAWGEKWEEYYENVRQSVQETEGEIVLYNGEPITAVYYSMSGGKTENSQDVWGGSLPYLKSVNSSFDENAPNFNSACSFTPEEFKNIILANYPHLIPADDPSVWVGEAVRSQAGGVMEITILGEKIKGTKMRSMFSLRSHNFTLEYKGGAFHFNVKGYGHGVGLSQWGSKFLAEEGKNYKDILRYYYTGVTIGKCDF